jgi:hypothetical protein
MGGGKRRVKITVYEEEEDEGMKEGIIKGMEE